MEILEHIFPPKVIKDILAIPIRICPSDDKLVWNANKFGRFSIKSAYHLISNYFDENDRAKASSSRIGSWAKLPKTAWKRIWSSFTLPKIKHFLWKACAHGIASRQDLAFRQILVDGGCRKCGNTVESVEHISLVCPLCKGNMVWVLPWFKSS
ncbi:hypothetical protein NE237_030856 [Protea cynaroides]|uniref:Reverse transcriptase zinc-binding domain-containing protein n=1 Tax=Protea cynaroides TaxID=273540 RepID=A0A9Q0GYN8_9MAGN|nr:hypothetical protein NE237_030856 [Protea cynaroides]